MINYNWRTYVLVDRITKTTWFQMNVKLEPIMELYKKDPEYYDIQWWTYRRLEDGDKLIQKINITVGGY